MVSRPGKSRMTSSCADEFLQALNNQSLPLDRRLIATALERMDDLVAPLIGVLVEMVETQGQSCRERWDHGWLPYLAMVLLAHARVSESCSAFCGVMRLPGKVLDGVYGEALVGDLAVAFATVADGDLDSLCDIAGDGSVSEDGRRCAQLAVHVLAEESSVAAIRERALACAKNFATPECADNDDDLAFPFDVFAHLRRAGFFTGPAEDMRCLVKTLHSADG